MSGSSLDTPEAFIRRMFQRLNSDGVRVVGERFLDADVEYHDDPRWPGGGIHHGRGAVIARFDEVFEVLGIEYVEVERVVDGGELVAWVLTATGRSPGAEVPNDHRWGYVGRISDGKLLYFRAYLDPSEAIAAIAARA